MLWPHVDQVVFCVGSLPYLVKTSSRCSNQLANMFDPFMLQRWHDEEDDPQDRVAATLAQVHRLAPVAAPAGVRPRPGLHKPSAHSISCCCKCLMHLLMHPPAPAQ